MGVAVVTYVVVVVMCIRRYMHNTYVRTVLYVYVYSEQYSMYEYTEHPTIIVAC